MIRCQALEKMFPKKEASPENTFWMPCHACWAPETNPFHMFEKNVLTGWMMFWLNHPVTTLHAPEIAFQAFCAAVDIPFQRFVKKVETG